MAPPIRERLAFSYEPRGFFNPEVPLGRASRMSGRRIKAIFLTGRPGVGKTTVVLRAVELLRAEGARVGGMISREVREGGRRVGFEIIDLATGRRGWLAHVNQPTGPRLGKYRVNLADLEGVGVAAIREAVEGADLVVIDEVGPMELFSREFVRAVEEALASGKPVLGTIHHRARGPLLDAIRRDPAVKIITVTLQNRDGLPEQVAGMLRELLGLAFYPDDLRRPRGPGT